MGIDQVMSRAFWDSGAAAGEDVEGRGHILSEDRSGCHAGPHRVQTWHFRREPRRGIAGSIERDSGNDASVHCEHRQRALRSRRRFQGCAQRDYLTRDENVGFCPQAKMDASILRGSGPVENTGRHGRAAGGSRRGPLTVAGCRSAAAGETHRAVGHVTRERLAVRAGRRLVDDEIQRTVPVRLGGREQAARFCSSSSRTPASISF